MANIIATTVAGGTVAMLLASGVIEQAFGNMEMHKLVRKDYQNMSINLTGKTIQIPKMPTLSAPATRAGNAQFVPTAQTDSSVTITFGDPYYYQWIEEDIVQTITPVPYLALNLKAGLQGLLKQINVDLLTLAQSLSTNVIGTAATPISSATIQSARKKLNDNFAPMNDRFFIVDSTNDDALLSDSKIYQSYAFGEAVLPTGQYVKLFNFEPHMSQYVTSTNPGTLTAWNMAFQRDALALVSRPLPLNAGLGVQQAIIEQDGVYFRVTYAYDSTYNANKLTVEAYYAVKTIRDEWAVAMKA